MTRPAAPELPPGPVHALVRANALRDPDAVALEVGASATSYGRLQSDADRLAGWLAAHGAAADVPIAILADDPALVVTAMLAILATGAAFVPLDPALPAARLAAQLALAEPRLVLASPAALDLARTLVQAERVVALTREAPAWNDCAPLVAPVERDPDGLAYVTFTSGSTGEPKAIAGRLKGIDHFVRWEAPAFGLGPGSRVSALTTPSFDAFLRDAFAPLCAGGTMCAPPARRLVLSREGLGPWIASERLTLVHCVPTVFRLLLGGPVEPAALAALEWVLLAGEALKPADVERWLATFGDRIRLVNLYGPSETTMTKFVHVVDPADARRGSVPIGRPMPGARAIVVDAKDRICPPGALGEILIGTPYRSLGYYRRPDLTAQAFVQHPFYALPGELVYRTGDVARVLDDGTFELIGRRDGQVKVGGVRVELGEIDGLLRSHPAVADVAVLARDDAADGTTALCAYVVAREPVLAAALRAYLAARLPEAMIPAAFVTLGALPRTITGKLDKRALPPPDRLRAAAAYVAPATPVEEILAGLWTAALGRERVGADDDFFELGGHSVLAMQLLGRIGDAFGVELPLRELFDAPTLRGLGARIDERLG